MALNAVSEYGASWHLGDTVCPDWMALKPVAQLSNVVEVLRADQLDQVSAVLDRAWAAALNGHWVCGFVSYEAAPAFDPALPVARETASHVTKPPLAAFVVATDVTPRPLTGSTFKVTQPWMASDSQTAPQMCQRMETVRQSIAAGRYCQLNLTHTLTALGQGDAAALFDALVSLQPAQLGFHVHLPDWDVVSASPELFFQWDGCTITTRPMKGTATPSGDSEADRERLRNSEKDRAENVMIVDLLRNDLSRIAKPGSVRVPSLFDVHTHPTVVQMTSTVQAQTREAITLGDVFRALFPCGSVTGAPKVEAMRHIVDLEQQPRGVYCGTVGVLAPGGKALFNVAIRTVVHEHATGQLRYGVGSGLTWDSRPALEWDEWQWKSRLAHRAAAAFEIVETVRLTEGQWVREEPHVRRMQAAAHAFGYPLDTALLQARLHALAERYPQGVWRVRWLLGADGAIRLEPFPLDPLPVPLTLQLAEGHLDASPAQWPFIRHKTTWRAPYDQFRSQLPESPDVLMHARDGALLETPRGNLVLADDSGWWTPDSEWQLPGVLQEVLLEQGALQRRRLTLNDVRDARGLWVINSLRGWLPVERIVDARGHTVVRCPVGVAPPHGVVPGG